MGDADFVNQEKPIYKKMVEYKKKIALVEGKRRAIFNKCEKEKSLNKEKEREIDFELKVNKTFLKKNDYKIFRMLSMSYGKVILLEKFF